MDIPSASQAVSNFGTFLLQRRPYSGIFPLPAKTKYGDIPLPNRDSPYSRGVSPYLLCRGVSPYLLCRGVSPYLLCRGVSPYLLCVPIPHNHEFFEFLFNIGKISVFLIYIVQLSFKFYVI